MRWCCGWLPRSSHRLTRRSLSCSPPPTAALGSRFICGWSLLPVYSFLRRRAFVTMSASTHADSKTPGAADESNTRSGDTEWSSSKVFRITSMTSDAVSLQVHAHSVSAVVMIIEAPEQVVHSNWAHPFIWRCSRFHPDIPAQITIVVGHIMWLSLPLWLQRDTNNCS